MCVCVCVKQKRHVLVVLNYVAAQGEIIMKEYDGAGHCLEVCRCGLCVYEFSVCVCPCVLVCLKWLCVWCLCVGEGGLGKPVPISKVNSGTLGRL